MAFVNLQGEPVDVSAMKPVAVNGKPVPPQDPLTNNPNPYLRATIPLTFQYQPDTLRQVPAKGFTQFRTPVLPASALTGVNATAQSVVNNTTIVSNSTAVTGMIYDGTWLAHSIYAVGDAVIFNESTYLALVANSGVQPDPVTSKTTWQLISENLVFNPDLITSIAGGYGPFDQQGSTVGAGLTASTVTLTPTYPGEMAIFLVGNTDGLSVPSGWTNLGNPSIGFMNAWCQLQTTTAPFFGTATLGLDTNFTTVLALFPFGANVTATITAVASSGTVATIYCLNNFIPGSVVTFKGLTNATYLNSASFTIVTASPSQITVASSHGAHAPQVDTGTATDVGVVQSTFSVPGNVGTTTLNFGTGITAGNTVMVMMTGYDEGGFGIGYAEITGISGITAPTGWSITNNSGAGTNKNASNFAYVQNATSGSSITLNAMTSFIGMTIGIFEFSAGTLTTQYLPFDVVVFNGAENICLTATNDTPTENPADWYSLGGASNFADIESGTNTTATMTVGSGAILTYSGSGVNNASELEGDTWEAPGTIGIVTPNSGAFSTLTATTYHDLPYDISMYTPGVFLAGQELVAMPIAGCTFPSGLGGSVADLLVASTGTLVFAIQHNGTTFGTITFTASASGVVTSSGVVTFSAGDIFSVLVTGSPDPTASTLSLFIPATRT